MAAAVVLRVVHVVHEMTLEPHEMAGLQDAVGGAQSWKLCGVQSRVLITHLPTDSRDVLDGTCHQLRLWPHRDQRPTCEHALWLSSEARQLICERRLPLPEEMRPLGVPGRKACCTRDSPHASRGSANSYCRQAGGGHRLWHKLNHVH